MDAIATKKREMVDNLMTKLGKYTVKVYLIGGEELVEIPVEEYGQFFSKSVYMIDVKGENHRFIIQWFGPRLPSDVQSDYRKYMDMITDNILSPREITRITVMQGHEDDTLLSFFPNGFICHNTERVANKATGAAFLAEHGAMYRVQGPFGEKP